MKDHSNQDFFWVPIQWEVAEYLLKNYQKDWEGCTPNGVDLDAWLKTLQKYLEDHDRIHFPHMVMSAWGDWFDSFEKEEEKF